MRGISIKLLLSIQLCIALLVCAFLVYFSTAFGSSALVGVLVMEAANGYFIKTLFSTRQDFDPKKILINFYRGELGKLVILAFLTALVAKYLVLTWWAYILGLAVVQFSLWLAPLCIKKK